MIKMTDISKEKLNDAIQEIKTCYGNNKILSKYFKDLDYNEYLGHINVKTKALYPDGLKEILGIQLELSELFCIEPNGDYTTLMVGYKVKR